VKISNLIIITRPPSFLKASYAHLYSLPIRVRQYLKTTNSQTIDIEPKAIIYTNRYYGHTYIASWYRCGGWDLNPRIPKEQGFRNQLFPGSF
jgi:hypothetical protein